MTCSRFFQTAVPYLLLVCTLNSHHSHSFLYHLLSIFSVSPESLSGDLMDRKYGMQSASGEFSGHPTDFPATFISPLGYISHDSDGFFAGDDAAGAIRAKIASHPLYPKLVQAYVDCRKVGAPPEIAYALENVHNFEGDLRSRTSTAACLGSDPELDDFMQSYCDVLLKYKSDISKPFDEATTFLHNMESQLNTLCGGSSRTYFSGIEGMGVWEGRGGSSEEELGGREMETTYTTDDRELKDKLLRKYSGYISTLKLEFSKKKKKGKLPKEARQTLLDWWNIHFKWPYPTDADKIALSEVTGLDQKQINNWFINQRKRHWKPAENMQFAVMDNHYGPFFHSS